MIGHKKLLTYLEGSLHCTFGCSSLGNHMIDHEQLKKPLYCWATQCTLLEVPWLLAIVTIKLPCGDPLMLVCAVSEQVRLLLWKSCETVTADYVVILSILSYSSRLCNTCNCIATYIKITLYAGFNAIIAYMFGPGMHYNRRVQHS